MSLSRRLASKSFRVDGDLACEVRRVGGAVTPSRQRPGGQLMEGRGCRVTLGVKVPAWGLAQGEQRVEVSRGPGPDVLGRGPRQREIEEHHVQGVAPPDHPHRNVVRLDVPVGDALLLEVIHDVEQVLTESLEMLDVEAPFLAQPLAERLDPILALIDEDRPHEKGGMFADLGKLAEFDNVLVPELLEHLGLVLNASVLLRVTCSLEYVLLAIALDQQGDGTGALPKTLENGESVGKEVSFLGLRWVEDILMFGRGEFVLDGIEVFQIDPPLSRSGS